MGSCDTHRTHRYLKQINHPVKDPDGMYYLSSRTLQRKSSKLSMEFAVQADQRIMTDTLLIGRRFINKFITDEVLTDIKNSYREYFDNNWLTSPAISSVEVVVEASPYDKKNNTARAYFIITFNNVLEKLILVRTIK